MTERLYQDDSYRRRFQARVIEIRRSQSGQPQVVLDRTLFYPSSGGQPHDTGTLEGVRVLDVQEDGDVVVHTLAAPITTFEVKGEIDWERRFDHMQQHTGQHILSQAFANRCGGETVSFHLGADYASVDISLPALTRQQLDEVEDLANQIIYENREITCNLVSAAALAKLPLRNPPKVRENIRIVEVRGFDWSPCGGTHCNSTGEIGIIKIRRLERRGEAWRVDFVCGGRALRDYRWRFLDLQTLGNTYSVRDDEAVSTALRLQEESKAREHELILLREQLLDYEAERLLAEAQSSEGLSVVSRIWPERAFEEIKHLAQRLTAQPGVVALLGVTGKKGQVVFACSADVSTDMSALLRAAAAIANGKGGGTPQLAQGGASEPAQVEAMLAHARQALSSTD